MRGVTPVRSSLKKLIEIAGVNQFRCFLAGQPAVERKAAHERADGHVTCASLKPTLLHQSVPPH